MCDRASICACDFHPTVTDDCSGTTWAISSCASDQPDNGQGDGNTTGDCVVAPDGQSVAVRAERSGKGSASHVGRRYVIGAVATDGCGNVSPDTAIGIVGIPHDQSGHDTTCVR